MARCSRHHKELDENGEGKCSVPMWRYPGVPAGFCDDVAYGRHEGRPYSYNGYVPYLACYDHGGPKTNKLAEARLRAFQAHQGDPCKYCGSPHDDVAIGPCPGRIMKGRDYDNGNVADDLEKLLKSMKGGENHENKN